MLRLGPLAGSLVLTGGLLTCGGLAACGKQPDAPRPTVSQTLTVTSPAFTEGGPIPVRFTCSGAGERPEIDWTAATPAAAYAVVVDDPDAPGGDFYHWVVLDLPAGATKVAAGALPPGAHELRKAAWSAPCPPSGTHHYRFTVYALSKATGLGAGTPLTDAFDAIDRASVAQGRLTGLFTHQAGSVEPGN
jgi:Raf kinase inhibitor-like YbhB/YbcL family protein